MKFKTIFILAVVAIFATSCYKKDVPVVDISFLSQTQTHYLSDSSTVVPGEITIDYIIYNNTPHKINYCEVYFTVYYKDNTYEVTEADVTVDIRNDQRNDLIIFTDKEMSYVDVHSVYIDGGGCRYNIIGY